MSAEDEGCVAPGGGEEGLRKGRRALEQPVALRARGPRDDGLEQLPNRAVGEIALELGRPRAQAREARLDGGLGRGAQQARLPEPGRGFDERPAPRPSCASARMPRSCVSSDSRSSSGSKLVTAWRSPDPVEPPRPTIVRGHRGSIPATRLMVSSRREVASPPTTPLKPPRLGAVNGGAVYTSAKPWRQVG